MAKSYELKETRNPHLFRVIDREGNWEHYYLQLPGMDQGIYLRGVTTILKKGFAAGDGLLRFLSQHSEKERDEILSKAGEKGDSVHRAIDIISQGEAKLEREIGIFNRGSQDYEKLSNAAWDALLSWSRFWADHKPLVYDNEFPLYSIEGGYAGTADLLCSLTKECDNKRCCCHSLIGKVMLLDYKTSGGIYASYWSQQAAYATADNIGSYLPSGKHVEVLGILRIGTTHKTTGGYEFKVIEGQEKEDALIRFHGAQAIAAVDYKPFTAEEIEDIPDVIEVHVERYVAPVEPQKAPTEEKVAKKVRKVAAKKLKKSKDL